MNKLLICLLTILAMITMGIDATYSAGDGQHAVEAEGISAEVIDLRTLDYTGMDYAAIGQSVKNTGSVLIVEQAPRSLTLGARISDEIQERFSMKGILEVQVRRIIEDDGVEP